MQPVPHPDTWFLDWLAAQKLLTTEILHAAYARLAVERRNAPDDAPEPTFGQLLEREGLLTRDQREAGEREAAEREAGFMAWRSQALRDQADRRPPPPD